MCKLVVIGFGFALDWMTKMHEIFKEIILHGNAKPKKM